MDVGIKEIVTKGSPKKFRCLVPSSQDSSSSPCGKVTRSTSAAGERVLFGQDCILCNVVGLEWKCKVGVKISETTTKFEYGGVTTNIE